MEKNRVKICFFGDLSRLSPELRQKCKDAQERSKDYDVQVNFCFNYGGRLEILQAARRFAEEAVQGKHKPEDLTDVLFEEYLYSAGVPDPELIIRPSGEMRTSNFLLWQSAYSEFVFMDVLWPDFGPKDLDMAIEEYYRRNRRFGGA
jgi:undecaprenyl diphosphate synthase